MHAPQFDRRVRPDWLEIDHWKAKDGWVLRRFRVAPVPGAVPRGNLLFQTGRADFIEKYLESFDHWRRQGWAIEGFDWRGQGGSGRMLEDPRVGHGPSYATMAGDLAAYGKDWLTRTQGPHVLMGHSMGGHLVLRMLAEKLLPVDGAVLLSPMLGLNAGWIGEGVGRLIARILCKVGFSERPAWSEDSNKGSGHRQRNLTHSEERYADEQWWRGFDGTLDVGPPTWGWLRDSWASVAHLFKPGVLEKIDVPMMILCAEKDRLVMTSAIKRGAERLPNILLLRHPSAAHELLREIDPIRLWALAEIDSFLGSFGKNI